jgi:hypothetical protein
MKLLALVGALLTLVALSTSCLAAGLAITPLLSPVWSSVAHLWPPVSTNSSFLLNFVFAGVMDFTPAAIFYLILRLPQVHDRMERSSWPLRLVYLWLSLTVFISAARWAVSQPNGTTALVILFFSIWALPACLFYEAFIRQEQERERLGASLWASDKSGRRQYRVSVQTALSHILGFLFERGGSRKRINDDVFGKSAAVDPHGGSRAQRNSTRTWQLAPGVNLKHLYCLATTKIYLLLLPAIKLGRLLAGLRPTGAIWLLSVLALGAVELNKATLSKLSDAVRFESIQEAYSANTDSLAKYELRNWEAVYEDAVDRGPAWWRYILSGHPAVLAAGSEGDPIKGWLYLDAGEKAASNPSNWNFNAGHLAADLAVWAADFRPAVSDLLLPFAWHDSHRNETGPVDGVQARLTRTYAAYSDYVAGLNQASPRRSAHVQYLLKTHQLSLSFDQALVPKASRGKTSKPHTVPRETPGSPEQKPFTRGAAVRGAPVAPAHLDVVRRVRDHQTISFWPLSAAEVATLDQHPIVDLPSTATTLEAGTQLRRVLAQSGWPVAVTTASEGEGWLVRTAKGVTGFVAAAAYQDFVEEVVLPLQPENLKSKRLEAPYTVAADTPFYILSEDQAALVIEHQDVSDRDKPVLILRPGTRMSRVLNESRHASAGALPDGSWGWLVRVNDTFGLVRESQYKDASHPEGARP